MVAMILTVVIIAPATSMVATAKTSPGHTSDVAQVSTPPTTGPVVSSHPVVGVSGTADNAGYWLVASDGGIFAFGDAGYFGSTGAIHLNQPIVGMASTADGRGYWLVASDGGIFGFGGAAFQGSTGAIHLNQPIVGMASTADGRGYWLVASDGGIFAFGDAPFCGSTANTGVASPTVGITAHVERSEYSLLAQDGSLHGFGSAEIGSPPGAYQPVSASPTVGRTPVAAGAVGWLTADINQMVANQSPGNQIGLWVGGDPAGWRASSGPGLAAAAIAAYNGSPAMLADAIQTFDTLIALHQQANGSFTAVTGTVGPQSPDIDTMFFVTNLGMALWALRSQLPAAEVTRWTNALSAAADFLVANGNLTYYTNGNINIGNALVMALAFWATGNAVYQTDYTTAMAFSVSPPPGRWSGFGLVYTKTPTVADGSDGAAYFAESGGGAPGFDANYTELQLDQLVRLYLVTRSADILRMINLEINQEMPLVNTTSWVLNTSGGTRHPQANRFVPFSTPALAMAAMVGGRSDLLGFVVGQVATMQKYYAPYVTIWNPGGLVGFGLEVASLVLMSEGSS